MFGGEQVAGRCWVAWWEVEPDKRAAVCVVPGVQVPEPELEAQLSHFLATLSLASPFTPIAWFHHLSNEDNSILFTHTYTHTHVA